MANRWYYSHDQQKLGPCSGQLMKELAASGRILATDTVWKEGVEQGIAAGKVKNLFPPAPAQPPGVAAAELAAVALAEAPPSPAPIEARAEAVPPEPGAPAPAPVAAAASSWQTPRKGRATAGRGALVVGQDGVNVKYRKKCTTCGHVDPSWNTMPIRNGVMRAGFYCPKCRKHRDVEVHGSLN